MEEQVKTKKKKYFWWLLVIVFLVGFFGLFFLKTGFTISNVAGWSQQAGILPFNKNLPDLPKDNPDRLNILLLGMRGTNEPGDGKLLSDAIILASVKKSTGQTALISFPRDLYARIWCSDEEKKINFAFAQGGLACAKNTVSLISGLYIDHAVSINFSGLVELVDAMGGIDIYLPEPFEESFQWAKEGWEENDYWFVKEIEGKERWVFHIATGTNHLDGQTVLYYVRSRYSTNDFDRMRRQQQFLMALKEKMLSLNVLANPVKVYNLLDILGNNVRTDMNVSEIGNMIISSSEWEKEKVKKLSFDTSAQGFLYHTFINEEYVLLPVGDNFSKIQQACKNIFE